MSDGIIFTAPLSGDTGPRVFVADALAEGLALNATTLFWTAQVPGVFAAPLDGGALDGGFEQVAAPSGNVLSFAADSQNLYFAQDYDGTVYAVALGSGAPSTLVSGFGTSAFIDSIASDGTSVYFTNGIDDGGVYAFNLGDGGLTTLALDQAAPGELVVGAASVYWETNTGISTAPLSGEGAASVLVEDPDGPYALALGQGRIYWLDEAGGSSPVSSIVSVLLDGGGWDLLASGRQDVGGNMVEVAGQLYWTESQGNGDIMTLLVGETAPSCSAGACVCPGAGVPCGTACVDESADPQNCGSCGSVVLPGATCTGGLQTCPSGEGLCQRGCIDITHNVNSCGACDNVCPEHAFCDGGCSCPSALPDLCGTGCTDVRSDPNNCGTCATTCTGAQICSDGGCLTPVLTTLASGLAQPYTMAADGLGLYYVTTGNEKAIYDAQLDGGGSTLAVTSPCDVGQLAAASPGLYWTCTSSGGGAIMMAPLDGGGPVAVVGANPGLASTNSFAIGGGELYWSVRDPTTNVCSILTAPLSGADAGRAILVEPSSDDIYEITAAPGEVFASNPEEMGSTPTGFIEGVPLDGGAATAVVDDVVPYQLAAGQSEIFYAYAVTSGTTLAFGLDEVAFAGGTPQALVALSQSDQIQSLVADDANLYWGEWPLSAAGDGGATVDSMSQSGGLVRVLAAGQAQPQSITFDATSLYWASQSAGTTTFDIYRLTPK